METLIDELCDLLDWLYMKKNFNPKDKTLTHVIIKLKEITSKYRSESAVGN